MIEVNRALRLEEASLRDPERIDIWLSSWACIPKSRPGYAHGYGFARLRNAGAGERKPGFSGSAGSQDVAADVSLAVWRASCPSTGLAGGRLPEKYHWRLPTVCRHACLRGLKVASTPRNGANKRICLLGAIPLLWAGVICLRLVYLQVFRYGDFEPELNTSNSAPRKLRPSAGSSTTVPAANWPCRLRWIPCSRCPPIFRTWPEQYPWWRALPRPILGNC